MAKFSRVLMGREFKKLVAKYAAGIWDRTAPKANLAIKTDHEMLNPRPREVMPSGIRHLWHTVFNQISEHWAKGDR
jgi:hypothetical protein